MTALAAFAPALCPTLVGIGDPIAPLRKPHPARGRTTHAHRRHCEAMSRTPTSAADPDPMENRRFASAIPPSRGFSLIELVIVLAIAAIIAAIAMPAYSAYVQRSKISEATGNLTDMRNRLEQYFYDKRSFPGSCVVSAPGPAPANTIYLPETMKHFQVTCNFPDASSYTVTATGQATSGMTGFVYSVDQANNRRTISMPAGWSGAGSTCWVSKQDGGC
jgi:type IV pilus assembly protein PilE